MSKQISNYDDFKKVIDLCLDREKRQHAQTFSDSANLILDQQSEAFYSEYQKSLSPSDLHLLQEIIQQLQRLTKLHQENCL